MSEFSEWLTAQYLNWQIKDNEVKNLTEFANYLGISKQVLGRYMNDTNPDKKNLSLIAAKLGKEAYIKAGLFSEEEDTRLTLLLERWHTLSDTIKNAISDMASSGDVAYPTRVNEKPHGSKTRKRTK